MGSLFGLCGPIRHQLINTSVRRMNGGRRAPSRQGFEDRECSFSVGTALVVPVFEGVRVLEKRVRLKEEVRITRRQRVSLRSEEVSVERFDDKTPGGRHG